MNSSNVMTRTDKRFAKMVAMIVSGTNANEIAVARNKALRMAEDNGYDLEQEIAIYKECGTIDRAAIFVGSVTGDMPFGERPPLVDADRLKATIQVLRDALKVSQALAEANRKAASKAEKKTKAKRTAAKRTAAK